MDQTSKGVIRSLMLNAAAAALIMAATAASGTAMAQEGATTPKPSVRERWEAPVGHRQPRAQDLPRKVQETEGIKPKGEKELDDKLKSICRGC
jgi:hypothetical protein